MECIEVSLPTLVLIKRSVFDCLPFKTRSEFSLEVSMKLINIKRGGKKRGGRKDKLRVRSKDLFSMECIEVSLPTLVLTKGLHLIVCL